MGAKTESGKVKYDDNDEFGYAEWKSSNEGGGPRWVEIWKTGAQGKEKYSIDPNPHDNDKYLKNVRKFYNELAAAIADDFRANAAWPKKITTKSLSVKYTLAQD